MEHLQIFETESLAPGSLAIVAFNLVAGGILCAFFGYRAKQLLLDAAGFMVFGLAAALGAGVVSEGNMLIIGVALVSGGIVGAVVAHLVFRFGLMLIGGAAGALAVFVLSESLPNENWIIPVMALAGIGVAALTLLMERFMMTLITSLVGAGLMVYGVLLALEAIGITPRYPEASEALSLLSPTTLSWAGFSGMAFAFQLVSGVFKKNA